MTPEYLRGLELLKRSFVGASETPYLVDLVAAHLPPPRPLSLLDVGAGSGTSLTKLATSLEAKGYELAITAIDRYVPDSLRQAAHTHRSFDVVEGDFLAYRPRTPFDVVNASQCLYYSTDPTAMLARLYSAVSEGGMLSVVLWTEACFLRSIHEMLIPTQQHAITAEDAFAILKTLSRECDVSSHLFSGSIDIAQWLALGTDIVAILRVLSRHSEALQFDPSRVADIMTRLEHSVPLAVRENAMLIATQPQLVARS